MPASLTVRERIDALLDPDSFHEIGAHRGARPVRRRRRARRRSQPANFVFGRGRIDGRPVVVGGDDFTVRGGAADASIWQKQVMSEQMANELRLPLVRLVDGTGGGGSVKTIETHGYTYVPANPGWELGRRQHGRGAGRGARPRLGRGPRRRAARHEPLFADGRGHLAHVHRRARRWWRALGQTVTKDELGGSDIHARDGAVDDVVASEEEAFARARRFLSYLPSSVVRAAAAHRADRRPGAARAVADRGGAARPAQGLRHAPILEARRRRGLAVRDGPQVRRLGHHRRWPGSTAGRSP